MPYLLHLKFSVSKNLNCEHFWGKLTSEVIVILLAKIAVLSGQDIPQVYCAEAEL